MNKKQLSKKILEYDINNIHQACNNLGYPTDWEYFKEELKTYLKEDMESLFKELREIV